MMIQETLPSTLQGRGQLFNLADDPVELVNRYHDPDLAALKAELLADLAAWTIRSDDPLPYPRHRYVFKRDERNWYTPHRGRPETEE